MHKNGHRNLKLYMHIHNNNSSKNNKIIDTATQLKLISILYLNVLNNMLQKKDGSIKSASMLNTFATSIYNYFLACVM